MKYNHIFGPVNSRRLGMSLGIDLVPYKTCSFDCVYCECGKTTEKTFKRKPYITFEEIKKELEHYLSKKPTLNYITLGGSGEPTLNSDIGKIINFLKQEYSQYKIAVLTNSSLLFDKQVQDDLKNADLVLPSLDAVSADVCVKINRPCNEYQNSKIVPGLIDFSKGFNGKIWLEIFVISDINDTKDELDKFKEVIKQIKPDKIQLNTLDRPGTEKDVKIASSFRLKEIEKYLDYNGESFGKRNIGFIGSKEFSLNNEDIISSILNTVTRRPSTVYDLLAITNLNKQELEGLLVQLCLQDQIIQEKEFFKKK